MPTYHAATYLNNNDSGRIPFHDPYTSEDTVTYAHDQYHTVTATGEQDALETVYAIGNHILADDTGTNWPTTTRSISIGDLIHLTTPDGTTDTWWACEPVGWRTVTAPQHIVETPHRTHHDTT